MSDGQHGKRDANGNLIVNIGGGLATNAAAGTETAAAAKDVLLGAAKAASTSSIVYALGFAAFAAVALAVLSGYAFETIKRKQARLVGSNSRTYNLQTNSLEEGATIPVLYGKHIIYPPLAINPFSLDWSNVRQETLTRGISSGTVIRGFPVQTGIDTYVMNRDRSDVMTAARNHMFLCLGLGKYDVSCVRVNNTDLLSLFPGINNRPSFTVIQPDEVISPTLLDLSRYVTYTPASNTMLIPRVTFQEGYAPLTTTSTPDGQPVPWYTGNLGAGSLNPRSDNALPNQSPLTFVPLDFGQRMVSCRMNFTFPNGRGWQPDSAEPIEDSVMAFDDYLIRVIASPEGIDGQLVPDAVPILVAPSTFSKVGNQIGADSAVVNPAFDYSTLTGAVPMRHTVTNSDGSTSVEDTTVNITGVSHADIRAIFVPSVLIILRYSQVTTAIRQRGNIRFSIQSGELPALPDDQRYRITIYAYRRLSPANRVGVNSDYPSGQPLKFLRSFGGDCRLDQFIAKTDRDGIRTRTEGSDQVNDTGCTLVHVNIPYAPIQNDAETVLERRERNAISVVATRQLPVYNGTTWVTQQTRNPIWAIADMITNTTYGGRVDRSNLAAEELMLLANFRSTSHFDEVVDSPTDIRTLLLETADLFGLGVFQQGSTWRVRSDHYRTVPSSLIFESDDESTATLDLELPDQRRPDIVTARYVSSIDWTERTIRVGTAPTTRSVRTQSINIRGLTSVDAVTNLCTDKMLKARYRNKMIRLILSSVGLALQPLDTIGLVHGILGEDRLHGKVITWDGGAQISLNRDLPSDGFIIFRDEHGAPTQVFSCVRSGERTATINEPLGTVRLITSANRLRTRFSFSTTNDNFYTLCKVLTIQPLGGTVTEVRVVVDNENAYA